MSRRLAEFEATADASDERSFFLLKRTHLSASRTGLVFAQSVGLLTHRRFQSPGHEAVQRGHGDVFHLGDIDIQAGAVVSPVLTHDNFSPAFGEFLDLLQIF